MVSSREVISEMAWQEQAQACVSFNAGFLQGKFPSN